MSFEEIGRQFAAQYYQVFDRNRAELKCLYRSDSMLTFEGAQFQGAEAIISKLESLPFSTIQHAVSTVDCQPVPLVGVLVHVVGQLKTDNDPPHGFSQTFCLKQEQNNFYLYNDIFRLSLHNIAT